MKAAGIVLTIMTLGCGTLVAEQPGCVPGSLGGATAAYLSNIYHGKSYDFCVTEGTIAETPSWFANDDLPPLSPRGAIRSAKAELSALITGAEAWRLRQVELQPAGWNDRMEEDKWIYVVSFHGPATTAYGGVVDEFRIIVLMDGKAVKPRVHSFPATEPAVQ